ncbi:MAG: ATPase [Phycisphaeraceae bacterium]|nr:ATPase [Phycisphaeraceae bacterium]
MKQSEGNSTTALAVASGTVRIGDLLLQRGVVSQAQIDQALEYQRSTDSHKLLGEILVELEFTTEEQVMEVLASTYDIPFARIAPSLTDHRVLELLPRDFIEKQLVLPLFLVNDRLTIAVHEPTNVFLVEEVERITGRAVQIVAATARDIRETLKNNLPSKEVFVIDDLVDDFDSDLTVVEESAPDVSELESTAGDSPVIKLVNHLIFGAVQEGASDIHIEPDENELRVRYRVDGSLFEKIKPPFQMTPAITSRIKIMAGMDISERRAPQDGGITVMVHKRPIDLRVSTIPGKFGEKVCMRIIDNHNALTSLDKLGFSFSMLEQFRQIINRPNGVVLVTGPTGSGKSTTLYGVLNEINSEHVNISTVEDPVEFNLRGVNQFQTNDKANFTFASALRSLLRQDPDIIMVGEIRDQETARIATQAALTGHLVLSTLHTNDAPSAVTRLFNVGVEPYLVAASIQGVLAQRLLRKICNECKEPVEIDSSTDKMLQIVNRTVGAGVETIYKGGGCSRCRNTGYAGRVGIYELYVPDDEQLDAISRGVTLQELRRLALASNGYTALYQDGIEKLKAGITTIEQLFKAVSFD